MQFFEGAIEFFVHWLWINQPMMASFLYVMLLYVLITYYYPRALINLGRLSTV